jgi:biopolymer transport protein ExbD
VNFRKSVDDDLQINLTPLIDVVFLLLIFFMVSTTFDKESQLQIRLPEASAQAVTGETPHYLEVQISQSGQYAITAPDSKESNVLINTNSETLRKAMQAATIGKSDVIVIIRADRQATHEQVVRVMDSARQLDLLQVTFATKNTDN